MTTLDYKLESILALLSGSCLIEPTLPLSMGHTSAGLQYLDSVASEFVPSSCEGAAVKIQKLFRVYRARPQILAQVRAATTFQKGGRSFIRRCNMYYNTCSTCRRSVDNLEPDGPWEGDACDDWGIPTCPPCLVRLCDLKGEWELFAICNAKRSSVRCDLRLIC